MACMAAFVKITDKFAYLWVETELLPTLIHPHRALPDMS